MDTIYACLKVRGQLLGAQARTLLNTYVMSVKQGQIHRDHEVPDRSAGFSYVEPVGTSVLRLFETQVSKFHFQIRKLLSRSTQNLSNALAKCAYQRDCRRCPPSRRNPPERAPSAFGRASFTFNARPSS